MNKYCLYILVCGFLLSLVYPGNVFYKKSDGQASVSVEHQLSSPVLKYPHTEFGINGNPRANTAAHSYRIQGGPAFLSRLHTASTSGSYLTASNFSNNNIFFKEYLAHIYPSHNYW